MFEITRAPIQTYDFGTRCFVTFTSAAEKFSVGMDFLRTDRPPLDRISASLPCNQLVRFEEMMNRADYVFQRPVSVRAKFYMTPNANGEGRVLRMPIGTRELFLLYMTEDNEFSVYEDPLGSWAVSEYGDLQTRRALYYNRVWRQEALNLVREAPGLFFAP